MRTSNRPLQFCPPEAPTYRVLSHAVALEDAKYARNAFLFNFCLVLKNTTDYRSYLPVVDKLATLFRGLEEQEAFLTREIDRCRGLNEGRIYAVCEILLEDLNNYSECMIPIDGTTSTLNIKLFPVYAEPPQVRRSDVPLLTVDLTGQVDDSWDLTMCRVLPHINGVNNVHKIALLADADAKLVREALRHLLYYKCMILLDTFSFSAIYKPTHSLIDFLESPEMQRECVRYVSAEDEIDFSELDCTELYQSLGPDHKSVRSLASEHPGILARIDMRRLMTFGVIKGFLCRVHRYAILENAEARSQREESDDEAEPLLAYLDGKTNFDEICTRLVWSEKELLAKLNEIEGIQLILR